ncbi:MAG: hypothetical protein U9R41_02015 [Candidatus Marinimicrobia bacterium]|nr:hypothetical protein [Candidatus Neomarinimicrobiota bacterium]
MKKILFIIFLNIIMITNIFSQDNFDKKNILKSIVLPGWGELSYNKTRSKMFLVSELTMWVSLFTFNKYNDIQDQDMRNYAEIHSGAEEFSTESQYWVDLGNYFSYQDHKSEMLEMRTPEKIYDVKYEWDWDTHTNANKYRDMRIDRDQSLLRAKFAAGGLVLNRIISAIDVIYLSNKQNHINSSLLLNHDNTTFKISIPLNLF